MCMCDTVCDYTIYVYVFKLIKFIIKLYSNCVPSIVSEIFIISWGMT